MNRNPAPIKPLPTAIVLVLLVSIKFGREYRPGFNIVLTGFQRQNRKKKKRKKKGMSMKKILHYLYLYNYIFNDN